MQPVILYTQAELLAEIEGRQRDAANNRWTQPEIYRSINSAIRSWGGRVIAPFLYSLTDGFSSNTLEYTLPVYVHPPIDVQVKHNNGDEWVDLPASNITITSAGATLLRLSYYPATSSARIIHWAPNSAVPATLPVTSAEISASATSVTVTTAVDVAENGYIKIGAEWMQYSGRVKAATTTVLSNLVRGCYGTTAATQAISSTVNWGIAVHRQDLMEQLSHHCLAFLHGLFLTDASSTEKDRHQWAVRWYTQLALEYWRTYTPARAPKRVLSREAIGDVHAGLMDRDYWRQGDTYGLWG